MLLPLVHLRARESPTVAHEITAHAVRKAKKSQETRPITSEEMRAAEREVIAENATMSELQQNGHTDTQGLLPTHLFERVDVEPSSVVSHRLAWSAYRRVMATMSSTRLPGATESSQLAQRLLIRDQVACGATIASDNVGVRIPTEAF